MRWDRRGSAESGRELPESIDDARKLDLQQNHLDWRSSIRCFDELEAPMGEVLTDNLGCALRERRHFPCGRDHGLNDEDLGLCDDDHGLCDEDLGLCDDDHGLCDDDLGLCDDDLGLCCKSASNGPLVSQWLCGDFNETSLVAKGLDGIQPRYHHRRGKADDDYKKTEWSPGIGAQLL